MKRLLLLIAVICCCRAQPSQAQSPEAPSALEFVRVYAPAERMDEWPMGDDKFVPVEAAEFERLTAIVARGTNGATTTSRARIEDLRGEAEFVETRLQGKLTLRVVHEGDRPALLPLSPWNLSIAAARWTAGATGDAVLGITTEGRLGVVVERGGELEIEFALSATTTEPGGERFAIETPAVATASWRLRAPATNPVSVLGAVVTSTADDPNGTRTMSLATFPGERFELFVTQADGRGAAASLTQQTRYAFATNGVEVTVDAQLGAANHHDDDVRVEMAPELELVSATLGATALEWRLEKEGSTVVVVSLPEDRPKELPTLRLTAWCPLRTGVRWRLPGMRFPDIEWRDGQVDVLLPQPLGLTQIFAARGMRQVRVGELAAPQAGESFTFDCHASDASLELRVDDRATRLSYTAGSAVEIGPRETTARTIYDIEVQDGEAFTLQGWVSPGWLVDDISTGTEDLVRDFERSPADDRRILVHLKKALRPRESLRLTMNARRANLRNGEAAPLEAFEPVRWDAATPRRRLISLRSSGEQRWHLSEAEGVEAITREQLSAADRELISVASEERLVALSGEGATAQLFVEPRPLVFRAEPVADFTLAPKLLEERYEVRCVPEQGAIDSFLVRFSTPRESKIAWSCQGAIPVVATAERVAAGDEASHSSETWQVRLWPPQTAPFVLRAERRTPIEGRAALALIEVPGASAAQGIAQVRAERGTVVRVSTAGPRPSPVSLAQQSPPIRAEYRYDPARDVSRAGPPAMEAVVESSSAEGSRAVVNSETTLTHLTANREWRTKSQFELEPNGASEWTFSLPPQSRLIQVARPNGPATFHQKRDEVHVDLAPESGATTLVVEYATPAEALNDGKVTSPLVKLAESSHRRDWRLALPRGWEVAALDAPWSSEAVEGDAWRTRLFGALGREGDRQFAPWRGDYDVFPVDYSEDDNHAYTIVGPSQGSPTVWIREGSSSARTALLGSVLAAAIVWRLGRLRSVWFALLPPLAAGVALIAPAAIAPVTSALFIGACLAAIVNMLLTPPKLRRAPNDERSPSSGSTTRSLAAQGISVLAIGSLALFATGHAAETDVPLPRVARVFVPVDDEQLPVGTRYYVPNDFWRELRERAAPLTGELPPWLLTSANYTLGSPRQAATGIEEITAAYELQTFASHAPIELAWGRQFFQQATSIRFDGQAVAVPAGDVLRIASAKPGTHRIEVTLRATPSSSGNRRSIQVITPPHPLAQFTAWLDTTLGTQLEVSPGPVDRSPGTGRLTARLGPVDEFQLSLPEAPPKNATPPPVEVDQLIWLSIAPERVTAEVRHQVVAAGRPLGRLGLAVDPRWKVDARNLAANGYSTETQITGTTQLRWDRPLTVGERFSMPLRLESGGGIGEVSWPVVEPLGAVVRRRWCAVSLDPAIEVTSLANAATGTQSAALFAAAWGVTAEIPDRIFSWPAGGPTPNLQTAIREPNSEADERATFVVHADHVEARLEATIDTTKAPVFVHRLVVPPSFQVDDVSVLQESAQQIVRWSRAEDGAVLVYLRRPVLGRHSLTLLGKLPLSNSRVSIPAIGIDADTVRARTVQLYRHDDALVDGIEPAPRPMSEAVDDEPSARLLGEWSLPQSQAAIQLRVRPNMPPRQATQVLSMYEQANAWLARIDANVTAGDGVVDELRFEIAGGITAPFTLDPPWSYSLVASPGSATQLLTVRPPSSQRGEINLRIEATPVFAAGAEPAAPSVRLLGTERLARFVALPLKMGERRFDWVTQGLRASDFPSFWQPPDVPGVDWKAYESTEASFSAVAQSAARPGGSPSIRYAGYSLRVESDGSYRGRTRLLIEPSGLQQLPVRLPSGAKILSTHVMQQLVDARRDSAGGWLLPLASDQFPQEVEILYSGKLDASFADVAPFPEIPQVAIDAKHWTIDASDAWKLTSDGTASSELVQVVERYRWSVESLETGFRQVGLSGSSGSSEGQRWCDAFVKQLGSARAAASDALASTPDRAASRQAAVEIEKLDQRVGTALVGFEPLAQQWREIVASPGAARGADALVPTAASRSRGATETRPPRLSVSAIPLVQSLARYLIGGLLIASAVLLSRGDHWSRALQYLQDFAWLWLVMAGIVWWLWLVPSVLGIPIALFGLLRFARTHSAPAW